MKKPAITPLPAGLYLVATPIGNLRDITLRALDTIEQADLLVCEDTRVSGKLLEAHGLQKKKMLPYNDHNAARQRGPILEKLSAGARVALISDAGTPLISDPGFKLVRDALDLGIAVTPIPGPSAPLAALQISGLPSDCFMFAGFLPQKQEARRKTLQEWQSIPTTLILFETAPRLAASLQDMATVLGAERPAAIVREITKKFEESKRGTLGDLASWYAENEARGEIVVVIGPPAEETTSEADLEQKITAALQSMSIRDAAAFVAQATGQPKKLVYERALQLGKKKE